MQKTEDEPSLTSLAQGGGCGCKLSPSVLSSLLQASGAPFPPELMIHAATRDDAAVYRLSDDQAIVATTDFFAPIVDDPYMFGRIAAANALSDIYAMGARPIFSLALLGAPVAKLSEDTIRQVLEGGRSMAESAGAPIAGGHSIDTKEPIYGLAAIGIAHPDRILSNAGAKPGDVLILGKPLGVGIYSAAQKKGVLDWNEYEQMLAAMTRLNTPGLELAELDGVHAVTDVTGFGLLGHVLEMCRASRVSAELNWADIPFLSAAESFARDGFVTGASERNWDSVSLEIQNADSIPGLQRTLLSDPQTSGGLLAACVKQNSARVLDLFHRAGHDDAAVIGRVTEGPAAVRILD